MRWNQEGVLPGRLLRNMSGALYAYLTRWRIGIAAQLLDQTELRLAEIADRYSSEYSLSRAYKQERGKSPIRAREEKRSAQ